MKSMEAIRAQFPILSRTVNNKPLIYFDNAASTQKPLLVIEALDNYYRQSNSNVHRGVHTLANEATVAYEGVRDQVQNFINASSRSEIIFTRGTTESLNLLAYSFGELLNEGDNIIVSMMEHHSNIVPWQLLAKRKKIEIKVADIHENGELNMEHLISLMDEKTKLVSVAHVSNVLGTINPVKEIIIEAHKRDIPVCLDGAQAIAHVPVDVQALDCDFYVFSGHKMYAPMGIGILYGKEKWLDKMPPYQGGGEMIKNVSFDGTTFNELPYKFEAGTPNVGDALGLGKAIEFMQQFSFTEIMAHEVAMTKKATDILKDTGDITFYGTAEKKVGVVSFLMNNIHPYDAGTFLDKMGIAIRTGTHCAEPLMKHFGIMGTMRASFSIYNTEEELDAFAVAIQTIKSIFE
ncbi:MAG: cysteine desulfurase CsdA [Marinilabiliales bacterium]|nr:MAG: cysteine desulfurase CsdA [Marinilabiliales bacterium]